MGVMRRLRWAIASVLALGGLVAPRVARAQEPAATAPAPAPAAPAPAPPADEDPAVVRLRERFREGFEKYRAGLYGEAILVWGPIYKELGPAKGYRLAFNLARAYDQIHDATRAADHYEAYLDEVEARTATGETLEATVWKQRDEASERIAALRAELARLRFRGDEVLVALDATDVRLARGTAYVTAGKHVLVYRPSTPDQQRIEINAAAGAVTDLDTPALAARPSVVAPPPTRWETHEERPFPKYVLYVGAAATAASFIVPAILYANAYATKDDYDANKTQSARDDYYQSTRPVAYASWAIPAVLGTATLALAAYWIYGVKTVRTPVGLLRPLPQLTPPAGAFPRSGS